MDRFKQRLATKDDADTRCLKEVDLGYTTNRHDINGSEFCRQRRWHTHMFCGLPCRLGRNAYQPLGVRRWVDSLRDVGRLRHADLPAYSRPQELANSNMAIICC